MGCGCNIIQRHMRVSLLSQQEQRRFEDAPIKFGLPWPTTELLRTHTLSLPCSTTFHFYCVRRHGFPPARWAGPLTNSYTFLYSISVNGALEALLSLSVNDSAA